MMNSTTQSPEGAATLALLAEAERRRRAKDRERYQGDAVAYFHEKLGMRTWEGQDRILRAVVEHPRVAVRSGHKVSKDLAVDTLIPTPLGWRTMGDLAVGDEVFSETGARCRVLNVWSFDSRPRMQITFEDGTTVIAGDTHQWLVHSRESRKRTTKPAVIRETRELAETLTVPNGAEADGTPRRVANWTVDLPAAIQLPEASLPLDPYLLGLWLGDGATASGQFTGLDGLEKAFGAAGFSVKSAREAHFYVSGLIPHLRTLGVLGRKHIPTQYLWSSARQRLALLQGLLDTDGNVTERGRVSFTNTNQNLAEGALHLARSLGLKARIAERRATLYGKDCGPVWTVQWASPLPVFRLPRHLARLRRSYAHKANAHKRTAITKIERVADGPTKCIEVDSPSHLFLCTKSFIPTHNSTSAAGIALWWVDCFPAGRVIITAPTGRQIRSIIWKEIRKRYRDAVWPIGGRLNQLPDLGLQFTDGREVVGFATDQPERMAGISGSQLLFLVDEASGVTQDIYEAIEGNRAGGAGAGTKVILFSNPTQTSGEFFDAFHTKRAFWHCVHISSEEAARVRGIPGLATPTFIEEKKAEWGVESPLYQVRVLGNFPAQATNSVVSLALVEAANERWRGLEPRASGPLVLGVDPARFGDDKSVILPRRGLRVLRPRRVAKYDEQAVADEVLRTVRDLRDPDDGPAHVHVDGHGVGSGVVSILRAAAERREIILRDIRSADPSDMPDEYFNLRSQMAFGVAEWLRAGGAIPDDGMLASDLVTPTYGFDARGRRKVEKKDEIKKRLGRSPDDGDALALAVYMPPGGATEGAGGVTYGSIDESPAGFG
jgi:phage terminase large subunit